MEGMSEPRRDHLSPFLSSPLSSEVYHFLPLSTLAGSVSIDPAGVSCPIKSISLFGCVNSGHCARAPDSQGQREERQKVIGRRTQQGDPFFGELPKVGPGKTLGTPHTATTLDFCPSHSPADQTRDPTPKSQGMSRKSQRGHCYGKQWPGSVSGSCLA
jgi:hypothetical protein